MSDEFVLMDLPLPCHPLKSGEIPDAAPDPTRPMLVYAMVLGYESVQGNNRFTLFAIEAGTDTGETYTVHRRYSEFAALYSEIKKTAGKHAKGLSFPKKRVVGSNFSPQFLIKRQNALDVFVRQLVGHPVLAKQMLVLRFFLRQFYGAEVMVELPATLSTPKEVAAAQEEENNLLMQAEMLLMGDPDLDDYNSSASSWGGASLSSSLSSLHYGDLLQGSDVLVLPATPLESSSPSGAGSSLANAEVRAGTREHEVLPYQVPQLHMQTPADGNANVERSGGASIKDQPVHDCDVDEEGDGYVPVPMPTDGSTNAKAAFSTFLATQRQLPSTPLTAAVPGSAPTPTPPPRQKESSKIMAVRVADTHK